MTPMLAQAQLDAVPDHFVKWFFVILFALILIVAAIVGIIAAFRTPMPQRLNDDPPIEVRKSPKRYNHDAHEIRFNKIEKDVAANTDEIEKLWDTMRDEDKQIRADVANKFEVISRALGRIEGALDKYK